MSPETDGIFREVPNIFCFLTVGYESYWAEHDIIVTQSYGHQMSYMKLFVITLSCDHRLSNHKAINLSQLDLSH